MGLSIDAVNKRIKRMQEKQILFLQVQLEPRNFGYPFVVDAKIKLQNITEENLENFIKYLKAHPKVIDLLSASGDWDITCVFIAKNPAEVEEFIMDTRKKFSNLIADWKSALLLNAYKFEEYNL